MKPVDKDVTLRNLGWHRNISPAWPAVSWPNIVFFQLVQSLNAFEFHLKVHHAVTERSWKFHLTIRATAQFISREAVFSEWLLGLSVSLRTLQSTMSFVQQYNHVICQHPNGYYRKWGLLLKVLWHSAYYYSNLILLSLLSLLLV